MIQVIQQKSFVGINAFIKKLPLLLVFACFSLISCKNQPAEQPLFQLLNSAQTHVSFKNTLSDNDAPGILQYLYFYNGGGVAVGDINNDGLPDLFFTSNKKGGNKLYLNKGNYQFTDITNKAGVAGTPDWCSGVTMADVNNDGWLDIYVCAVAGKLNLKGHNLLYINNRDGTFSERSAAYGLDFSGYSTQAVFFDYNHDGNLDCFLLNQSNHSVETYGDTSSRRKVNQLAGSKLYLNQKGHFIDVTSKSGIYSSALGYGLGVAVGDLNNDGWEDIYVGNDFHENDYEYINNRNGTFTEAGARHFNHYSRFSMGNDMADFNNDGQLDIFTADMLPGDEKVLKTYGGDESYDQYKFKILNGGFQNQYSRNCLQKNLGNGEAFSEVGLMDGVAATDWSWSPLMADFDNDGIKDLFIANGIKRRPTDMDYISYISDVSVQAMLGSGHQSDSIVVDKMPTGEAKSFIFKGTESEKFIDKSSSWGVKDAMLSNGAAYADLNNSGHLDLITNNLNHEACIYKNLDKNSNYLSLKFTGKQDNRFGIGAKAYVFCGKQMQYAQLMLTRGFQSSVEPKLHFGLKKIKKADSLLIVWPNQTYQVIKNLKANQLIGIDQKNAGGHFEQAQLFKPAPPLFQNITAAQKLNWKHRENSFIDFNWQPLIPHMLSAEGPRMAVADVNRDGLEDFYICGAKGQAGALFIQQKNGGFKASNQPAFVKDAGIEGVDAAFLDANQDGFMDLYVASGGAELTDGSPELADRLYLNDTKGNFINSNTIPVIKTNKAAVAVADVNRDGYPDIFVGGTSDNRNFGKIPEAYLLLNSRKGNFKQTVIPAELKFAGMLRSAVFADLNNDGWPDLVVAGEWMPVKVFISHKGNLVRQRSAAMEQLTGWWQRISVADADGDGKPDIICGNYGWNSKLKPSAEDPIRLYLADLDKNGTIDPLLTYSSSQKNYTFLGKGEIEKQVPLLKKKFLYYHDFAFKTVEEVFGDSLKNTVPLAVNTFSSGIFYNKGGGNFEFKAFPSAAQVAPLFALLAEDVNEDGKKDVLCGGNFYGVLPYEGRYDADFGNVLINAGNRDFQTSSAVDNGFLLRGEVRDIKKIKTKNGYIYAVARNNAGIEFFRPKPKSK